MRVQNFVNAAKEIEIDHSVGQSLTSQDCHVQTNLFNWAVPKVKMRWMKEIAWAKPVWHPMEAAQRRGRARCPA